MICEIALRRVIIIRNESMTTASAMPSVLRAIVVDICVIGWASPNANTTSTIPTSIVVGMLIRGSVSQRTFRRAIRRWRIHGRSSIFSATDSAAE